MQQQPGIVTHSRISSLLISRHLTRPRVASRYSVRTASVTGSGRDNPNFCASRAGAWTPLSGFLNPPLILLMSVFFNEPIASPMSEDCCHYTSVSNVYVAAWQEIVKPAKVIELRMFYCSFTGQIGQGLCVKHVSRRSSHTCSSEELFLAISMLWKCIRGKCYSSWSENWRIHLSQKRKLPLPPFASATTF